MEDALSLLRLAESHVDWDQIQGELEEFTSIVGGARMNVSNYRALFLAGEDVRRDVLQRDSVKKVIGDASDLLRELSFQLTAGGGDRQQEEQGDASASNTFNTLFMQVQDVYKEDQVLKGS